MLLRAHWTPEYLEIDKNVKFLGAVELGNTWREPIFVDNDNGLDGAFNGRSTSKPYLNLAKGLTEAAAFDVIYIKPKAPEAGTPPYLGGDPGPITPATAVNWVIPYTKHGVQIVGCGVGRGAAGIQQTLLKGHAGVTAYPVLDIRAPYCNIENLGFKRGGSTSGLVRSSFLNSSAYQAFATTFYKLWLRLADAAGGIVTDSAWYDKIEKCIFSSCARAILIGASNSVPVGLSIEECDFDALVAEVTADIYTTGAVTRITMKKLNFNHAVPSGGAPNRYVSVAAASTGLISNCFTGAVDPTIADNMTLNGILYSHIWGDGVGPFVDA